MNGYDVQYDVIVCGGGTSGVAAAVSAARAGAKVLLIEKMGALGGQMNVSGPPGFSYARLYNCFGERDIGGFLWETYQRLYKSGHALPGYRPKHRATSGYTFNYVDPDWWGFLMFDMMEENGVTLLLDTMVVGALKDGDKVTGVTVEAVDGRHDIKGKVVIDCTGEAYVASFAGCETECVTRDEVQPHTIAFTADGIDWDKLLDYIRRNPDQFNTASLLHPASPTTVEDIKHGWETMTDPRYLGEIMGFFDLRDIALANGDWHPYSGVGFFCMPREGNKIQIHFQHSSQVDKALPTDAWDVTRCHIECRKQIQVAWRFFKNYVPGFENAYITRVCTELRFREGPRIIGDYRYSREDVRNLSKFDDVIGMCHDNAGGYHVASTSTLQVNDPENERIAPAGSYSLPYRILVPKKIDNLLAAGKCVSADRASYLRYVHQTMVTGQAAGVAAALCARDGKTPRELEKDVSELQKILVDQGAILYQPVKGEPTL